MRYVVSLLVSLLLFIGCSPDAGYPPPTFARAIPWAEDGVWLKADTHVHTKFSDGGNELKEVVEQAVKFGCQVVAITDHADAGLSGTSEDYFLALEEARSEHPELVLLAGLEWNVPPWQGREHACVLIPPGVHERKLLRDFQVLFDDLERPHRDPLLATSALRWLNEHSSGIGGLPVVFYNHPNRKREEPSEFAREFAGWQESRELAVGFEGAPGHQEMEPSGAYLQHRPTVDRWDSAVANIGDAWDQLLQQGQTVWGALATSDFHANDPDKLDDYWPGEFSETWLYAASATPKGALDALRSGSFFGVHGHIARQVGLKVWHANLPRPAIAGEAIRLAPGSSIEVSLELETPNEDFQGLPNHIDEIEIIAITGSEAKSVYQHRPVPAARAAQCTLVVPSGGLTVRARGRRIVSDKPDLMFYTNPIQILTFGQTRDETATSTAGPGDAAAGDALTLRVDGLPIPSAVLLAFIGCGGVLIALIDQWRIEAVRRYAGSKANSPVRHTKAHKSVRVPLAILLIFLATVVFLSLSPFQFGAIGLPQALARWWSTLKGPLRVDSLVNIAIPLLLFVPIGFSATWILLGSQPSDRRRVAALPIVVGGCFLVSASLQLAQQALSGPPLLEADMLFGNLGGLAGGAIAVWLLAARAQKSRRRASASRAGE